MSMNQQPTLPPFSLYNVGNQSSKSCYQSQNITVLCNLVGPYFERNKITIEPTFNCNIIGASTSNDEVCNMNKKIKQILSLTVVKQKYLRMNFDVNFHIVENKNKQEIFPALINLLCFTLMLSGVQIKSVFSCAQIWLADEKIYWQKGSQKEKENVKRMCIALESSAKQIIYSQFQGQFIFVHFQRLSNLLMDANQQIHSYIIKKVGQINDQYQN